MTDDQLIESLRARTWPGDCEAAAFRLEELRALAAELKALREQKPSCWTTYPPSGRYSKCKAEVDLWERNNWTIVPLYTHPVPGRELTDADIALCIASADKSFAQERISGKPVLGVWSKHLARAIERHLKGEGE